VWIQQPIITIIVTINDNIRALEQSTSTHICTHNKYGERLRAYRSKIDFNKSRKIEALKLYRGGAKREGEGRGGHCGSDSEGDVRRVLVEGCG
jgi:hypothetical protein